MFFRDILKHSSGEESSFEHVKKALESMDGVALYINEFKKHKENKEKLQELSEKISGYKGKFAGKTFIRQASLLKLSPKPQVSFLNSYFHSLGKNVLFIKWFSYLLQRKSFQFLSLQRRNKNASLSCTRSKRLIQ